MKARTALLTLSLLAQPALASPQATIELPARTRVPAGTVPLGEVAHIRTGNLELIRKLVHLPVGQAPQPGDVAVLRREALAAWVRRQSGLSSDQLEWTGAEETQVVRALPQVRGEELARAAVEAVHAQLAAAGRAAEVQARVVPRDLDFPGGEVRLAVRGVDGLALRPRMTAWVDVWAGPVFVRAVPVALELLFVAGERPGAGPTGDDQPLQAEPVPGSRQGGDGPPAVLRGDFAVLRSTAGTITLESRVEVLQDGRPGQKVRVRPSGAAGPLFARVLDRGLLELAP